MPPRRHDTSSATTVANVQKNACDPESSSYGSALRLPDPTRYATAKLVMERTGNGWPKNLFRGDILARGSNSKVFRGFVLDPPVGAKRGWEGATPDQRKEARARVKLDGDLIVRTPRHDSDTIHASHSKYEFACTLLAAYHGVGVDVYDAFFAPRTTKQQRKGLHMIQKWYPMDLAAAILEHEEEYAMAQKEIGAQLMKHIATLASLGMFLYDLKSANVVLSMQPVDVRIIDYGKEFCERRGTDNKKTIDAIDKIVSAEGRSDAVTRTAVMEATMLVILSAVITHELHANKRELKTLTKAQRQELNPMYALVREKRLQTSPLVVRCVKQTLREEVVRDTVAHYTGSRNASTYRLFEMAGYLIDDDPEPTPV